MTDVSSSQNNHFDAIVIGSGIGGLTTAALLAKIENLRILVLEKHFKAGGFTHIFKRENKYLWDVGVHYIGGMQEKSMLRQLMDIVTNSEVDWHSMPDVFEKFVYPDLTFSVPNQEELYRQQLKELFPEEKQGIDQYFDDIKSTAGWFSRHVTMKAVPPLIEKISAPLALLGRKSALETTASHLDVHFRSPELKGIVASQWGDYGLPPSQSAFVIHSLIVSHYLEGGFYPIGGSGKLATGAKNIIERAGGQVLLYHDVQEILIQENKAIGVRAVHTAEKDASKQQQEYFAPVIVSDAGAYNTYMKLLPESHSASARKELTIEPGTSNVTLYLGLKESPEKLGFKGENHWMYSSYDHDENFRRRNELVNGNPSGLYLSFPSLKDPEAKYHTAEIISFVDYEPFGRWADLPWKNRGPDYNQMKDKITESLIAKVNQKYPGFADLIDYKELSTPITNEFFTGHQNGTIYGIPCRPERFRMQSLGIRTSVKGLYLTGADASSPGVAGAMMGGYGTAATVLGLPGILGIIKAARK